MNFFNWVIMFPSANGMRDPVMRGQSCMYVIAGETCAFMHSYSLV